MGNWTNRGVISASNATINLGGNLTVAEMGNVSRVGGELNLTGTLNNTNTTLLLDGTNGTWTLDGGSIRGGTVVTTNGARLSCTFNSGNRLDGVVLNGELDAGNTTAGSQLVITNGLTLNGIARVGNPSNNWYGVVTFQGSQTLGGNAEVIFGGLSLAGYNALRLSQAGTSLTLGPGIRVHGKHGTLGTSLAWGGPANIGLTNQGSLRADVPSGVISIRAQPYRNEGLMESPVGAIELAGPHFTAGLGAFQSTGGQMRLSGVLENSNATLILNGPANVLTLAGGTVHSGNVVVTNGASLIFGTGTLDGVVLDGRADAQAGGTLNLTGNWINRGLMSSSNATLNVGGNFTVASLEAVSRFGGILNLTGTLNNSNTTLVLDGTNGSWTLDGGRIRGGTILTTNGARLSCAFNANNLLDGVSFTGDLEIGGGSISAQLSITNGLVLNGTARVGNPTNNFYGFMSFPGTQTLSGNGEVIFGGINQAGYNALRTPLAATSLTLGPGITVHGKNGTLGYSPTWGGASNIGLTNRGSIVADVSSGTITVRAQPFTNLGATNAINGGTLVIAP